jgi:hypothetical protein
MVSPTIFFQNSTFSIMPHLTRKRDIALMAMPVAAAPLTSER